ncbi:MAG: DUF5106 domain-containing protein [Muribaculaceae bacterium]|nr:DUF5106 domain-containing protein [Muribaculaceae bacterium]
MREWIGILLSVLLLAGCTNGSASNTAKDVATSQSLNEELTTLELPLPDVPSTITKPQERAAFIIEHFWDAMDFSDTLRSHNSDFIEQNFANFLSVFPYAEGSAQRQAVEVLLRKAECDRDAYVLLTEVADKYLYDPNSPMLSEDYYILFLEQIVATPILDNYDKLRPRNQLEDALKNRPGMTAIDFRYETREGRRTTLYKTQVKNELLMIFYDPDCDHCKEIITALRENQMLKSKVEDKSLTVLAVYSGDMRELWAETSATYPADWIIGYESGAMQENGSYILRAMPTLYLLNSNKQVILKDVLPQQLIEYLSER